MPTKAQCWVVSYARRRGNEGRVGGGGASREGLLAIPMQSNVMLLHLHPDGARLAHGEYVAGLSPGRKIDIGDYECELLMLAPHGGGGNPAYAAAFVMPGEVLPSMKPHNKDEGWLSWLGLDEDYDEEPMVLRAPQLPHPSDPQPSAPIAFGYSGFTAACQNASYRAPHTPTVPHQQPAYSSYQSPKMAQNAYERETAAKNATSRAPAQPASRTVIEPAVAEPPRQRERKSSVFEEEFLEKEAFDREVRFEQANENERMVSSEPAATTTTLAGTQDEMESLRRQLAELEKLTGVRADDAELELKEDILKAQELIAEVPEAPQPLESTESPVETVVETAREVLAREAPAPTPASTVAQPKAPPSPCHVADVEVPQTLSVSSNIFKANDGRGATTSRPEAKVAPAPAPPAREAERVQASPVAIRPSATSPVVRSVSQRTSQPVNMPVPSVVDVTPEEVNGNAAWAAAVARRNRSVDEESDASDDDFDSDGDDKSRASAPSRVVENVASQPNRVKKGNFIVDREKEKEPEAAARENEQPAPELTSVASKLAAFEYASRTPPSKPSNVVASPKAENGEEYVQGSVAARASMFGEQASFRRGGRP